jgi:hypothetical protein
MKLTQTQTLVVVGIAAVAAYMLLRKKPLSVADLPSDKAAPLPNPLQTGITVSELKKKGNMELNFTGFKSPVKQPLYIKPRNVVPSIYDRGIGDEVNFYGNLQEGATVNISNACKATDRRNRLRTELPKIN